MSVKLSRFDIAEHLETRRDRRGFIKEIMVTGNESDFLSALKTVGRAQDRNRSFDAVPVRPIHPGEILKYEFMEPLGLTSEMLAEAIGAAPAGIDELIGERRGISAETALRLARYFGTDAESWMSLQDQHELALAQDRAGDEIAAIRPVR